MALKIESDSRQIPKIEKYTADKKYNDLLYSFLQEMSYKEKIGEQVDRYINKEDIVFSKLADQIGLSRQVVSTKFKNLIKIGLVEFIEEEKRYKLSYLDASVAMLIPIETLRKINNALSQNSISIYVYLLKRFIANNEKEYPVTMAQMKNFIGIASNTTSNNEVINDILEVLELLGLVKIERRQTEENKTLLVVVKVNNKIKEKSC